jgi:HK97 family phage prohead protease
LIKIFAQIFHGLPTSYISAMEDFDVKNLSHTIKGLDDKKGIVEAYANVYNFEDSDGDISAPGSFKRTVNNNLKRIKVLKDHRFDIKLGVPVNINADDPYGLFTISQFNLEKDVSRDMYYDIKLDLDRGMNSELSIGYQVMKRDSGNKKIITEYKLFEYSFLTSWGANEMSLVTGIKSSATLSQKDKIESVMGLLTQMFNLNYSDQRLKSIESLLESLQNNSEPNPLDQNPTMSKQDIINLLNKPFQKYGC